MAKAKKVKSVRGQIDGGALPKSPRVKQTPKDLAISILVEVGAKGIKRGAFGTRLNRHLNAFEREQLVESLARKKMLTVAMVGGKGSGVRGRPAVLYTMGPALLAA